MGLGSHGGTYLEITDAEYTDVFDMNPPAGRICKIHTNAKYYWFSFNLCNCPASRFTVSDIPLLTHFVGQTAVTNAPTIEDTVSAAYTQNCGSFTVSLETQTLSSPTLTVADFLTVDPTTGALSLSTSNYSHLGTHTVKMKVTSTGYDQTSITNGSAGNLPTMSYTFDVKIDMCPLDITVNTSPTDQTARVRQTSSTAN